ncbi:hypothetical protein QVD99_003815 [Batrachochytrium dendrobatidis]|nr:hypothetical protein QVD99_003815 [Batrachochytrium dendrobatidis]
MPVLLVWCLSFNSIFNVLLSTDQRIILHNPHPVIVVLHTSGLYTTNTYLDDHTIEQVMMYCKNSYIRYSSSKNNDRTFQKRNHCFHTSC